MALIGQSCGLWMARGIRRQGSGRDFNLSQSQWPKGDPSLWALVKLRRGRQVKDLARDGPLG